MPQISMEAFWACNDQPPIWIFFIGRKCNKPKEVWERQNCSVIFKKALSQDEHSPLANKEFLWQTQNFFSVSPFCDCLRNWTHDHSALFHLLKLCLYLYIPLLQWFDFRLCWWWWFSQHPALASCAPLLLLAHSMHQARARGRISIILMPQYENKVRKIVIEKGEEIEMWNKLFSLSVHVFYVVCISAD